METNKDPTYARLFFVTANVGSLFEDPSRLLTIWLEEFIAKVKEINPRFLALHLQEVGGKTYENSMDNVQEFIRCLCDAMAKTEYIYVRIYMDEDFKSAEHFTALGNIYFGHKDLSTLKIWNFQTHKFQDILDESKEIFSGNIENVPTKEKSKFPQHFFPECKWSRKGFMRCRWEINGTAIDLINIHLFHDASNLAACEDFPSVYCKTRRRALIHTIERFHLDDKNKSVPFFLFGDFNFRCDTAGVVKKLTSNLTAHRVQSIKNENTKINYRNSDGNNILTVGKKEFSHADHQLKFKECWLKEFDREMEPLKDILVEYPITFIPSYPFEEDPEMPTDYMATRCPSWCDRILMNPQVKDIIEPLTWNYDMIGESVCMGDHKPICLTVHLKPNKGTYRSCDCSCKNNHANNNNDLTSPVQCKFCPYLKKLCNQMFKEVKADTQDLISKECQFQFVKGNLAKYGNISSGHGAKIIESAVDPNTDKNIKNLSSDYPTISINLIESDNIYACTCTRTVLSENIIVNQIDTHHLNACNENVHLDPYTPESNESHSPYSEIRSTSTTTSSNSRKIELCLDINSDEHTNKYTTLNGIEDLRLSQSVHAIKEKQLKSIITPLQLRSRLEDLQRISMHSTDGDVISVKEGDTNSVKAMSSPKNFLRSRNPSIFSMCCSIH